MLRCSAIASWRVCMCENARFCVCTCATHVHAEADRIQTCVPWIAKCMHLIPISLLAGGVVCRRMLEALTQAHLRHSSKYRAGYGSSWRSIFSLASVLGHDSILAVALSHLAPCCDFIDWGAAKTADEVQGQAKGSGDQSQVSDTEQNTTEEHDSALVRVCFSGRVSALHRLLPLSSEHLPEYPKQGTGGARARVRARFGMCNYTHHCQNSATC